MANYYTFYSFEFPASPKEVAWIRRKAQEINQAEEYNLALAPEGEEHFPFGEYDPQQGTLWLYHDNTGESVGLVADTLQAFLQTFHPTWTITFEWANSCSKPRLNSFGGGAALIEAEAITFMNTWRWLAEQLRRPKE